QVGGHNKPTGAGIGCLAFLLLYACSGAGAFLSGPADLLFLAGANPGTVGAHQELWLLAGGSPLAALGVAWWAGRGRRRPVPRRSLLTRAGLLLAACTLAAIPVESYALSRLAALLPAADPSAGYVVVSLVGA